MLMIRRFPYVGRKYDLFAAHRRAMQFSHRISALSRMENIQGMMMFTIMWEIPG
jgi:hypothetical protein